MIKKNITEKLVLICFILGFTGKVIPMVKRSCPSDTDEHQQKVRISLEGVLAQLKQELERDTLAEHPSSMLQKVCEHGHCMEWPQQKEYITQCINAGGRPTVTSVTKNDPLYWAVYHQDKNFVCYLLQAYSYPPNAYQLVPENFKNQELNYTFRLADLISQKKGLLVRLAAYIRSAVKGKDFDLSKTPNCVSSTSVVELLSTIYEYYTTKLESKIDSDAAQLKQQEEDYTTSLLRPQITASHQPLPEYLRASVETLKQRIPILQNIPVLATKQPSYGYASSDTIYLNPDRLKDCTPNVQLAVLAHEVGHVIAQDPITGWEMEKKLRKMSLENKHLHQFFRLQEIFADIYALLLGPDICKGAIDFAELLFSENPNPIDSTTHPSALKRKEIAQILDSLHCQAGFIAHQGDPSLIEIDNSNNEYAIQHSEQVTPQEPKHITITTKTKDGGTSSEQYLYTQNGWMILSS